LDRIIVSWNGAGQEPPLANIHLDAIPEFELYLFDYSGSYQKKPSPKLPRNPLGVQLSGQAISLRTECKGQILEHCEQHLRPWLEQHCKSQQQRNYVAILDDDILIGLSDLNRALHIGRQLNLTTFSPSLSRDSFCNHSKMLSQAGQLAHRVSWVEIMMPFIDQRLFHAAQEFYGTSISSWGIDCYAYPMLAIVHGLGDQHAVLDHVVGSHIRPVTSGDRTFSNGLTAHEELKLLKQLCLSHLQDRWPALLQDSRIQELFGLNQEPSRIIQRLKKLARLPSTIREKLRTI